jgi:hypothetical protein
LLVDVLGHERRIDLVDVLETGYDHVGDTMRLGRFLR